MSETPTLVRLFGCLTIAIPLSIAAGLLTFELVLRVAPLWLATVVAMPVGIDVGRVAIDLMLEE